MNIERKVKKIVKRHLSELVEEYSFFFDYEESSKEYRLLSTLASIATENIAEDVVKILKTAVKDKEVTKE